jgi:anti-anti-sigma factor
MNYALKSEGETVVATLDGKIDYSTVGTLDDAIRTIAEINPSAIVFDLSRVPSMDSVGLGLLLSVHETFSGKSITLRNLQPHVSHLLDLTAARSLFVVAE